jgi:hypothetical protein
MIKESSYDAKKMESIRQQELANIPVQPNQLNFNDHLTQNEYTTADPINQSSNAPFANMSSRNQLGPGQLQSIDQVS